jgi:glycerate 2-kinase
MGIRQIKKANMMRASLGMYVTALSLSCKVSQTFQPSAAWKRMIIRQVSDKRQFRDSAITFNSHHSSRTTEEIQMTQDALSIVTEAIDAVNPSNAIRRHLRVNPKTDQLEVGGQNSESTILLYHDPNKYRRVLLLSFGKASSAMATSCLHQLQQSSIWRNIPVTGAVIVKDDHATQEEWNMLQSHGIQIQEASHPIPDERSVQGARHILDIARKYASPDTLVLCCISGGGSSLFCEPQPPLTLDDLRTTNSILLASGLSIMEMNVIRKRLETGKGGKLAQALYPSTVLSLVLSDILGDPLDLIASGPTVPDSSTPKDAWKLINNNSMLKTKLPQAVLQMIKEQVESNQQNESANPTDESVFEKCAVVMVGNNGLATRAAANKAKQLGYNPIILGTRIQGEAKDVAGMYIAMAHELITNKQGAYQMVSSRPVALIGGGETTVTLPSDHGIGGRNQELALAAAMQMKDWGLRNVVLISVGTDGTDGPTDAAGAVVDGGTVQRLSGSAVDALQHHDAYTYLKQMENGDDGHSPLIRTGPTGTNVADVCITLIQ